MRAKHESARVRDDANFLAKTQTQIFIDIIEPCFDTREEAENALLCVRRQAGDYGRQGRKADERLRIEAATGQMRLDGMSVMEVDLGAKIPSWYPRYLDTNHWKSFRIKAIEHNFGRCCTCDLRRGLDVHHLNYRRLGEEHLSDVTLLCREHHDIIHRTHRTHKKFPKEIPDAVVNIFEMEGTEGWYR